MARRVLGGRDADWQAARPTTPYAPPSQPSAWNRPEHGSALWSMERWPRRAMIDQGGLSAHLLNLEADGAAVPDQPAEGGDVEAPAEVVAAVRGDAGRGGPGR